MNKGFFFTYKYIHEAIEELEECFAYDKNDVAFDREMVNKHKLVENSKSYVVVNDFDNCTSINQNDVPTDNSLLLVCCIPEHEKYQADFLIVCKKHGIDTRHFHVLSFMAAIFLRTIHKVYDPFIEDIKQEILNYQNGVRPDMLKLYIALKKDMSTNGHKTTKICFGKKGNIGNIEEHHYPWFHYMLEAYLEKFLAVSSVEEAQEELEILYPTQMGKRVKAGQAYINYIIASTHKYIARNIIVSEDYKVTVAQCRLLLDFLNAFHLLSPDSKEQNLNNLQSKVKSLYEATPNAIERYRRNRRKKPFPRELNSETYWDYTWK